jgi:hypothetical protein
VAVEELVQAVALHLFTPEEAEPSSPSPLPGPVDDTGERVDATPLRRRYKLILEVPEGMSPGDTMFVEGPSGEQVRRSHCIAAGV